MEKEVENEEANLLVLFVSIINDFTVMRFLPQNHRDTEKNMIDREIGLCNAIIHSASAAAAGVGGGLAQIPCSDNALITPIQLAMAVSLGKVFGVELDQSAAKAAVASAAAATVGRVLSQVLVGWIPVVGNVINATTAAALTETMGWILAEEFAQQA